MRTPCRRCRSTPPGAKANISSQGIEENVPGAFQGNKESIPCGCRHYRHLRRKFKIYNPIFFVKYAENVEGKLLFEFKMAGMF